MMISARFASNSSSARPGRFTEMTGTPSATPRAPRSARVGIRAVTTSSGPASTLILLGGTPANDPAPLRVTTRPSFRST
jgi:hypothetical protein